VRQSTGSEKQGREEAQQGSALAETRQVQGLGSGVYNRSRPWQTKAHTQPIRKGKVVLEALPLSEVERST
jgi:hypothetical protein